MAKKANTREGRAMEVALELLNKAVASSRGEKAKFAKAFIEASLSRSSPVNMQREDAAYKKELKTLILERFKNSANPKFVLDKNELVAIFDEDEMGPRYKIILKGPMRRIRTAPGLTVPRRAKGSRTRSVEQ